MARKSLLRYLILVAAVTVFVTVSAASATAPRSMEHAPSKLPRVRHTLSLHSLYEPFWRQQTLSQYPLETPVPTPTPMPVSTKPDGFDPAVTDQGRYGSEPVAAQFAQFDLDTVMSGSDQILFSSDRGGNPLDLFVMNVDGTNVRRLTDHPSYNRHPRLSHDGGRIAFQSNRTGVGQVYTMNTDGSDLRQLTHCPEGGNCAHPDWSHDDSRILYSCGWDTCIMNADGSGARVLLSGYQGGFCGSRWSPDNTKIVTGKWHASNGDWEIHVVDADGTNPTRLTENGTLIDVCPSWSPDGARIVFARNQVEGGPCAIFVMDLDGGNDVRLTDFTDELSPVFSPDGGQIVFKSRRDGGAWDIFRMDADGSNPTRLTYDPGQDEDPFWFLGGGLTTLSGTPVSVPADGVSSSNTTLSNAPAGHRVRLISSRGSLDAFDPVSGVVNSSGLFLATVRSSTPSTAVITAEDLTTGQIFATSTDVTFTPVSGEPSPPPANEGLISIAGVASSLPLSGWYPATSDPTLQSLMGEVFRTEIAVTVDWRGTQPGRVVYSLNGAEHSMVADTQGATFSLDMSRDLQSGLNTLSILAYNASGEASQMEAYAPVVWDMSDWLVDLLSDAHAAAQVGTQQPESRAEEDPDKFGVEFEVARNPWAVDIWFKIPPKDLLSRVHVPVGKFETKGVQAYARLRIPLEGADAAELRAGAKYLSEFERRRAAGYSHKGLSILGTEFSGDLYLFGKAQFDMFVLTPEAVGGGAKIEVSKSWERSWLALLYLIGIPDPTPALKAVPVVGEKVANFVSRIAMGWFKIKGRAGADLVYLLHPERRFDTLDLTLGTGSELGLKADIKVAEVRGNYGADLDATLLCLRNALEEGLDANLLCDGLTLKGGGAMEVKALGFKVPVLEFPSLEETWFEPSLALSTVSPSQSAAVGTWRLIEHIESPHYAKFEAAVLRPQAFSPSMPSRLAAPSLALRSTVTSLLVSSVYTYSEPALTVDPSSDEALLVWVHDDVARPVGQSHEIYFSRWDGDAWTVPEGVTDDTFLDGAPQVAYARDGGAVAVWERVNATLPVSATLDVTTTQKLEIVMSVYDPTLGVWSAAVHLTNNTVLDAKPHLVANTNGDLLAVWRRNEAGLLGGTIADTDSILAAFYDGAWSAPEPAGLGIPGVVDLAAGYGDGQALIAYTQEITPSGWLTPSLQLLTSAWDGSVWAPPVQRTDDALGHRNPQVIYSSANEPLLVWLAGDELRLQNLDTAATVVLALPAEVGGVDEFRVVQDGSGNIAAVFTAQAIQRDLYVAFYDQAHNLWGRPVQLTADRASEGYPAPTLDATGRLLMGYAATAISDIQHTTTISGTGEVVTYTLPTEGQTDLITLSHVFTRNLTLADGDLAVSDSHPLPGSSVVLSATVRNTGDLAAGGVAVTFYDGDPTGGGVPIGTSSLAPPLAAGFTRTLTTTYDLPTTGGARLLYAVADPEGAIVEWDENDNTATLAAFGPDLMLAGTAVDYWGGSQVGLISQVRNVGTTETPSTTLEVYWGSLAGTLAVTDTLPPLAAGEAITQTTPWDHGPLAEGEYPLVASVNTGQLDFSEVYTDDNHVDLTVEVLPDLAVSPYYLWAAEMADGRVVITGTVYNVGSVASEPVPVEVWADEPFTDTQRLVALELAGLDPAGSETFTTTWDKPELGSHTIYLGVDPGWTLTETTRANNLASVMVMVPHGQMLATGFNLLSLPLEPQLDVEEALDEITSQGGSAVAAYRWLGDVDAWEGHARGQPFNDFPLTLGQGYFVQCDAASTWSQVGQRPADPVPVDLDPIWTLIGLPVIPGPMTAEDLLQDAAGQGGGCTEVHRWQDGWWDGHAIGTGPGWELRNDEGYFVKCANAITYAPGEGAAQAQAPGWPAPSGPEALALVADPVISDIQVANRRDVAFSVTWETDRPSTGWMEYGETKDLGQATHDDRGEGAISQVHHVTLTGLTPETTVHFRVHSGETVDDNGGAQYQVATNATTRPPVPYLAYGEMELSEGAPAVGSLVRAWIVDEGGNESKPLSTVVDGYGYWSLNLPVQDCEGVQLKLEAIGQRGTAVEQVLPACEVRPAVTIKLPAESPAEDTTSEIYLPIILRQAR